jgi:hypothetical protein
MVDGQGEYSVPVQYVLLGGTSVVAYLVAVQVAKHIFDRVVENLHLKDLNLKGDAPEVTERTPLMLILLTTVLMTLLILLSGSSAVDLGLNAFIAWPLATVPASIVYMGFNAQIRDFVHIRDGVDFEQWSEWLDSSDPKRTIEAISIEAGRTQAFYLVFLKACMLTVSIGIIGGSLWQLANVVSEAELMPFMVMVASCPFAYALRKTFFSFTDLHKKFILECLHLGRLAGRYVEPFSAQALVINRWRTRGHQSMFQLASLLRRLVSKTRRRLSARQFEVVQGAYLGLAVLLEEASTSVTDKEEIARLGCAAATLVTNVNLAASAKKILEIPGIEPPDVKPIGRLQKGLDFLTDAMERRKPLGKPLLVLLVLIVLVWAVAGGQATVVVNLLHKLLGM